MAYLQKRIRARQFNLTMDTKRINGRWMLVLYIGFYYIWIFFFFWRQYSQVSNFFLYLNDIFPQFVLCFATDIRIIIGDIDNSITWISNCTQFNCVSWSNKIWSCHFTCILFISLLNTSFVKDTGTGQCFLAMILL